MKFITNQIGMISIEIRTLEGRRKFKTNTKVMAEAELMAKELNLAAIEAAGKTMALSRDLIRKLTQSGKKKVVEAMADWSSWLEATSESANTHINMTTYGYAWAKELKLNGRGVDELTEADVDAWVNDDGPAKLSTRSFRLAVCRSFIKFCCIKRYIDVNVADLVRVKQKPLSLEQKTKKAKRVFTDEEYDNIKTTLLQKIDSFQSFAFKTHEELWLRFWYCAIVLGRRTALRLSDIACMEKASIQNSTIRICTDKKNTWVECNIDDEILTALAVVKKSKHDRLFPAQCAIASDPKRRCQLSNRFRAVMKMCGITDHFFHELRSSRASEIVAQGGEMKDVAKALGHGSEESSQVYVIKS